MLQVLDGIQDNYTFAQPGIQTKIRCWAYREKTSCSHSLVPVFATSDITSRNRQLEELQKRVDLTLHTHIVNRDVQYLQFSFRSNFNQAFNLFSPPQKKDIDFNLFCPKKKRY